ncbi:hypothetical protein KIN20_018135 [Parelaphostrongylus tenuis]|uniref:Aquaporin n=1 Tax=Parelaphostrongylus tenuis TaxID=148309 RepID=A0AAD5N753_PARTN|nr:hypothetical protein KIN20_018135 [Parelaphostrongylus tenuis]
MAGADILPEERLRRRIHIHDPLTRNALSEFFGTFMLVFIGLAINMQFILSGEKLNTWIQINLGWGLTIAFCVYACCKTSGGHLNPAVSIAIFTLGKLPAKDCAIYCVVQTIGAFLGAMCSFAIYYDQLLNFAGDHRTIVGPQATAGSFCSFPAAHVTNLTCFFDQVVGTGLLLFFVCVVMDKRIGIPNHAHPFLFGMIVTMIGTCMGMNLGYPINPARDLGPRFFTLFIYGPEVFTYHSYYFWIPVFAPVVGAVAACWIYHLFIGAHIPGDKTEAIVDDSKMSMNKI